MSGEHAAHDGVPCVHHSVPAKRNVRGQKMPKLMEADYSFDAEVSAAHSAFQECGTRDGAAIILDVVTLPVLRRMCDRAYVDMGSGTRRAMANGLMLDRWGCCDDMARPDDDPAPGDRCKECGGSITWVGPSMYSWRHVSR